MIYNNVLYHVGNENSGRYPRGSGERPYQHTGTKKYSIEQQQAIAQHITGITNNAYNTYRNIDTRHSEIGKKKKTAKLYEEVHKMDDTELKSKVERLIRENNYVRNIQQQAVRPSVKAHVFAILDDIKDVAVTATSLLTLLIAINKIRGN